MKNWNERMMKMVSGRLRRGALGLLVAVALAASPGCAWKPEIVTADPTLSYGGLAAGKLTVMPVKFDSDQIIPPERYNVYQGLSASIRHVRSDLPLVSNDVVQKAAAGAPQELGTIMGVYSDGVVDPALLASLRSSLGARYLVLSRLSYEQRPVGGLSTVESTLSGTVSLLDAESGHVVWAGKFTSTRSGIDSMNAPHPSSLAVPFFSTIVDGWPSAP
jgi:hypothetical protein